MIRFVFRFAGLVALALGFIFLVHDGTKSIADQTLYLSSVSSTWENVHQSSLAALQPVVERIGTGRGRAWSSPTFLISRSRSCSPSSVPSCSCWAGRRNR